MEPGSQLPTVRSCFPRLSHALNEPQAQLGLPTAFRSPQWPLLAQTLALAACRQRDTLIAESIDFPLPWYDKDLAGDWGQPLRTAQLGRRALRAFHAAGIEYWRDLVERTPRQVLEVSGAGLVTLNEALYSALELTMVFHTDAALRHGIAVFGAGLAVTVKSAQGASEPHGNYGFRTSANARLLADC